jgi:hypothetical protein
VTLRECTVSDIDLTYWTPIVVIGEQAPDSALGGVLMLARLLMRLIADLLFDAAQSRSRSYEAEVDRYLQTQGFTLEKKARPAVR